jgi:uncharacterized protein YndB with AHSA1/START domain
MTFHPARLAEPIIRKVEDREHEGLQVRAVVASRIYDTDINDCWDALTNAERIPRWFLPISGDLRQGGNYKLEGNAGGTIVKCEPPRHFTLTWEAGGTSSWVIVRLSEESAQQTRIELEHIAPLDNQYLSFWEQFGPGAVGVGWDLACLALAEHLATGKPIDRTEGEEWPLTEQGKNFVNGSSQGWAAASIAFGTDQKAAASAAEQTTTFYTVQPDTEG